MKNILVVADMLPGSGLTEFVFNVFSSFNRSNYNISILGYGNKDSNIDFRCKNLGWNVYRSPVINNHPLKHILFWNKFLKFNKFDIIYFNYSSSWNFLPLVMAKNMGTQRIVCHSHNSYFSHTFSNIILNKMLIIINNIGRLFFQKYSDIRVATSKDSADWMFGNNKKYPVNIIDNGIIIKRFLFNESKRTFLRQKLSIMPNEKLIGFVGVLDKRKNPLFALKTFAEFLRLDNSAKFLIIGTGPMKNEIKETSKKLKIENKVKILNYTSKVNEWYSAMDALIFPSIFEGFGLVPVEAQISNLPSLVSENIPRQVLENDTSKILKLSEGYKFWAKKLTRLLESCKNNNRNDFNNKLLRFAASEQAKKIEKLMEENL